LPMFAESSGVRPDYGLNLASWNDMKVIT
jgi:hypothetical protein